jgi:hypothetical protein
MNRKALAVVTHGKGYVAASVRSVPPGLTFPWLMLLPEVSRKSADPRIKTSDEPDWPFLSRKRNSKHLLPDLRQGRCGYADPIQI